MFPDAGVVGNERSLYLDHDPDTTIYLAGPIEHAEDSGQEWRNEVHDLDLDGIEIIDPTDIIDPDSDPSDERVVSTDFFLVTIADAVVADWNETKSPGSAMELFHAAKLAKPVVLRTEMNEEDMSRWTRYVSDACRADTADAIQTAKNLADIDGLY